MLQFSLFYFTSKPLKSLYAFLSKKLKYQKNKRIFICRVFNSQTTLTAKILITNKNHKNTVTSYFNRNIKHTIKKICDYLKKNV